MGVQALQGHRAPLLEGLMLGLTLRYHCPEILKDFDQGALHFHLHWALQIM